MSFFTRSRPSAPAAAPAGLGSPRGPERQSRRGRPGCGLAQESCASATGGGDAGTAGTDAGGGGGGGDGYCGGEAGGAGGAGGGGGGGGGAGGSSFWGTGTGTIGLDNFAGNASVILRFTRTEVAPQITSASSFTVPYPAGNVQYTDTAAGFPDPTFALSGAPAWLPFIPPRA